MNKFLLLLISLLLASLTAQSAGGKWSKGAVILTSDSVMWGDIKYDFHLDIVQCKTNNGIKAFSPFTVKSFRFYDEELKVNRFFKVFEATTHRIKRQKVFYEEVLSGSIHMLRRQRVCYRENSAFTSMYNNPGDIFDYDYYIFSEGKLFHLLKFKKRIVQEVMKDFKEEVESFISSKRLIHQELRDQIIIIDFYNSLKDPYYISLSSL